MRNLSNKNGDSKSVILNKFQSITNNVFKSMP